ncbi:hypothetical protein BC830DRAFT_1140590 [Chytriomyces sp. MP71]|nr:hypothetical protein BC830DRAFT_1140590 [Chytriomyces sp. MP71]
MSKKATEDLNPTDKTKLDELSIEIYEARVRDLTEKLTRSKEKCDALYRENDALGRAQAKFSSDKQDIVEFLNIKVREHEEYITSLELKIQNLEDEKRAMEHKAKLDLDNTVSEWKRDMDIVQTQSAKYRSELDLLFDFKGKKDELENQLKKALALLEIREREYKDVIHTMERKVLQDKNQMKKEMLQKVNEAVANFRKVADQQMAETTKRAIRENMAITSQLKKMSAKTLELIAENEGFKAKLEKLKTSSGLLAESEKELAKKNQANQRVIKMLLDRLKESDEMLEIAYEQTAEKEINVKEDESFSASNSGSFKNLIEVENLEVLQNEYGRLLGDLTDLEKLVLELESVDVAEIPSKVQTLLEDSAPSDSLKYRILHIYERAPLSKLDGSSSIQEETTQSLTSRKHYPIEREKEIDLSPVIAAIPPQSATRFNTAEPITTNSVGVQTLPLVFRALNDGSSVSLDNTRKTDRVMNLLSEVRPWGPPAASYPKKGRLLPKIAT